MPSLVKFVSCCFRADLCLLRPSEYQRAKQVTPAMEVFFHIEQESKQPTMSKFKILITLSEISQTQKDKYHMIPPVWGT